MNIEEFYKPVTCQEVTGLLPKIVQGEELASSEGDENRLYLVEGHIESCDRCLSAYSDAMDQLAKHLPRSGSVPPVPMLPKALSLSFLEAVEQSEAAASGTLSPILRARVEQLREHEDRDVRNAAIRVANVLPAANQPTEGKSRLPQEVQHSLRRMAEWISPVVGLQPVVSTLGGGPVQAHKTVSAVDSDGKEISLTILSGPVLTKDGCFRFTVHGSEDRQIGMQLECAVTILKGERVRILTSIRAASDRQGWDAVFDEVLLDPALRLPTDREIKLGERPLTVRPSIT